MSGQDESAWDDRPWRRDPRRAWPAMVQTRSVPVPSTSGGVPADPVT